MKKQYDIIIVGGGIAGVAAALEAARNNKRVAILEKNINLGGLATLGLVTIYLPLCDGLGHQVSFGLAEELLKLSISMGYQRKYPYAWLHNGTKEDKKNKRYEVQFNPIYFSLLIEQILLENEVDIFYEHVVQNVNIKDNKIDCIFVDTYQGLKVFYANVFVDASGDAKLFNCANCETKDFEKGNILASWYYSLSQNNLKLNMLGTVEKSDYMDSSRHTDELLSDRRYNACVNAERNQFIIDSHQILLEDIKKKRNKDSSFEAVLIPSIPQLRMNRTIIGKKMISEETYKVEYDSIGIVADWRRKGYIYEIPFSSMINMSIRNCIAAGRCISANDKMIEVTRVIPACAVTGQAAGAAASLYVETNSFDVENIQTLLKSHGQKIHISELEME